MSQPGPVAAGNLTLPDMPGRILGIDAGGSGTRVILLQNGTVTARPDGPPMNALLTDGFAGHLRQIIEATGQGLDTRISEVCTHPAERDRLTALAPAITALAAEDPEARKIALRAAEHLADLAEAIRRRLGPLPVAGAGRVFSAPVIWDRFAELTGAVRPLAAATVGAALLAGQQAGQRVNG